MVRVEAGSEGHGLKGFWRQDRISIDGRISIPGLSIKQLRGREGIPRLYHDPP